MTNVPSNILVLGGTGKTGSRLAAKLAKLGLNVRTAARHGADVHFDWDDPTTHPPALQGIDRVYLVAPVMRMDFADQVATFVDLAETAGVRHATYLSAYGIDQAPPQVALRAVELDLIGRAALTHSLVRPAWFMQNFSETFLKPVDGVITVPTANGSEAFIDASDIAAVAAETLGSPDAHAGAAYALTGPEALTVSEAAEIIADVTGKPMKHNDIDRDLWIQAAVAAGVPAEYGEMLRTLTETIASGMGSRPNDNVEKVTGAPPIRFADFARRTAQAWTQRGPIVTTITDLDDFKALDPFFRIIEKGLDGIADGGHFFDLLAEDVIFDYIITTPDYPRHVEGRKAVSELYRPYGTMIVLDRCHDLAVHHDIKTGVVVLEYASEGRVVPTGAPYTNRYISVLTITDRKVTHWRDYLDPVAVFDALGWPSR